jgi:hypothetical protein
MTLNRNTDKRIAAQALLVLLAVAAALIVRRSDLPAQGQIASTIAQEWAAGSVSQVADTLANTATLGIPGLRQVAALVIKGQIQNRIYWTFSTPRRSGDSYYSYEVSATAIAPFAIDILVIHKQYTISGSFSLQIDTQARRVISSRFDAASFRFQETKPAGAPPAGG